MQARGVESIRVLVGLKSLAAKHDVARLDKACKTALSHGAYRLRTIRELLKRDKEDYQEQFEFIEEHPIIRPLKDYSLESLSVFTTAVGSGSWLTAFGLALLRAKMGPQPPITDRLS